MPADLTTFRTYDPPVEEDRVYHRQYDEGYREAMRGMPYDNRYATLDIRYSRIQDLKSYWWQAGYDDYEEA